MGDWGSLISALQRLGTVKVAAAVILFYFVSVAISLAFPEPVSVWGIPSGWLGIALSFASSWLIVSLGDWATREIREGLNEEARRKEEQVKRDEAEKALGTRFALDPEEQELIRVLFIEPGRMRIHVKELRVLEKSRPGMMDAANRLHTRSYLSHDEESGRLGLRGKVFDHFSARPDLVGSDAPPRTTAI